MIGIICLLAIIASVFGDPEKERDGHEEMQQTQNGGNGAQGDAFGSAPSKILPAEPNSATAAARNPPSVCTLAGLTEIVMDKSEEEDISNMNK